VRDLYIGFKPSDTRKDLEWLTVDRDLDLAVFEFAPGSIIVKDKAGYRAIGFTGALPGFAFRKKAPPLYEPMGPALGNAFWLIECANCNSWFRTDTKPSDPVGTCSSCHHSLDPERSAECREPLGFRTNFVRGIPVDSEGPSGRHRSVLAEANNYEGSLVRQTNARASVVSTRLYKLNRGGQADRQPGVWQGFNAIAGADHHTGQGGGAIFGDQWLDPQWAGDPVHGAKGFSAYEGAEAKSVDTVWLAAPKTTDLLSLIPASLPDGLAIENLVGPRSLQGLGPEDQVRALTATAVRAAALSATFILANRAASELDIDPEEFDVLEPRVARPGGGERVPILQIADHLVNGAGFCRELIESSGQLLGRIIRSCVLDEDQYPLNVIVGTHERSCEQACYLCLLRFRNQPYHGLLDWRLGLAYLSALADPDFACGLDGHFTAAPYLRTWTENVDRDVTRIKREFPNVESREYAGLRALRFDKTSRWALVAHPLWDTHTPKGILADAVTKLSREPFAIVDSFNLSRRPVAIRSALLDWTGS
jgi:hypothetical protein